MSRLPSIGIDVGASKVVAAIVEEDGTIVRRYERRETPGSQASSLVESLVGVVRQLSDGEPVGAVGVGTAGLVVWPEGDIEFAANHNHRKLKLRRNLAAALGSDAVVVENDANAAAWAEYRVTPARADEGLLFLAIGTGLGSGFVANGELLRGQSGRGAEIGHLIADAASGVDCKCGFTGCLEALASGLALAREGRRQVVERPDGSLARRFGGKPERAGTRAMITATRAGDAEAVEIVHRMGELIGKTIALNVMSLFPAQHVVVGGGLAKLGDHLLSPMRRGCRRALSPNRWMQQPRFELSALGADAIAVGAALRAGEEAVRQGLTDQPVDVPRVRERTHLAGAGRR